jgi:hypothetical protein
MMDRRTFLAIATGALATPLAAEAQQAGKMYRIGLCHVGLDHEPPSLPTLKQALAHPGVGGGRL